MKASDKNCCERVFELVRQIPLGCVMTYGQIAEILGKDFNSKVIFHALQNGKGEEIPWQRVVNADGGCVSGRVILPYKVQQKLLEAEGVEFNKRGRCDLKRCLWMPADFKSDLKPESVQMNLF